MAAPVPTITLDAVDITGDVQTATTSRAFGQVGTLLLLVDNSTQKYDPDNGGSPIAANLKLGKVVRFTAVYNAVTYAQFHGFLRRVNLLPLARQAELVCEDAMGLLQRGETSIALSDTRSLSAFRGAILDYIGIGATARNLAAGTENNIPVTGADQANALRKLAEVNDGTGSVHVVLPTTGAELYKYTSIDRVTQISSASAETFNGTTTGVHDLSGYSLDDQHVVNSQRAQATPRARADAALQLWAAGGQFTVQASTTETYWASWNDPLIEDQSYANERNLHSYLSGIKRPRSPAFNVTASYVATNTPSVVVTAFATSAKIEITAGVSSAVFSSLSLSGVPAQPEQLQSVIYEDATSIAAYGRIRGNEIRSDYLESTAAAYGLARSYVYRYADPVPAPPLLLNNVYPAVIQREPGERITLTVSRVSVSRDFLITGITRVVNNSQDWQATLELEAVPAADTWFQLDTAARGLDDGAAGAEGKLAY